MVAKAARAEIIDPRPAAVPEIAKVFSAYPHIENVLLAMGYGNAQLCTFGEAINSSDADRRIRHARRPFALARHQKEVRPTRYEFVEAGEPKLSAIVYAFVDRVSQS